MDYLKTLYHKDSKNKIRVWSVKVIKLNDEYFLETIYGIKDMKISKTYKKVESGKNKGKKNETSVLEQAEFDAKSLWNSKIDKGYSAEINYDKIISPMLALDFEKRSKDIKFPCTTQPKLDGCRAIFNKGKLFSRNGKEFKNPKHIIKELENINIILDGELFSPSSNFQKTVSSIKNDKEECSLELEYWVFDIIDDGTFINRYDKLKKIINDNDFKYIKLVDNTLCNSVEDIKNNHEEYLKNNYEGTIIRNIEGEYKTNHRSKDLQKFKYFKDQEFKIIGFDKGAGMDLDCVVWICSTQTNKTFRVRPRGTVEERKDMYLNGENYINKYLNVRYQEMTNDGLPRFPVGISIRDYE